MHELIRKTLYTVFSSTRPMAAHFTQSGDRTQSFCVDFEQLDKEDDETMASEAWGSSSSFLEGVNLSKEQSDLVIRCGEDVMLGAFILSKLGGKNLLSDLKQTIIDDTVETFEDKIDRVNEVLSISQVNEYFDHCLSFGSKQATY